MVCQLPLFYPPPELIEANSSSSSDDDLAARRRRRRDTDSVGSGSTLLSRLWNVVQRTASWWWLGLPASSSARPLSRHKRAVASVSKMNVSMKVDLGFIMDKLTSLRNISKTKPNLRLELIPFIFKCDDTPVNFDPTDNQLIKIEVVCHFDSIFYRVSVTVAFTIYRTYIQFMLTWMFLILCSSNACKCPFVIRATHASRGLCCDKMAG